MRFDMNITTSGIGRRDFVKQVLTDNGYEVNQMHIIASDWNTTIKVDGLDEALNVCRKLCMNPDNLTFRISEI